MKGRAMQIKLAVLVLLVTGSGVWAQDYALPDSLPVGVTLTMVERGYTIFHGEGNWL